MAPKLRPLRSVSVTIHESTEPTPAQRAAWERLLERAFGRLPAEGEFPTLGENTREDESA